jgi:hypothetical protein
MHRWFLVPLTLMGVGWVAVWNDLGHGQPPPARAQDPTIKDEPVTQPKPPEAAKQAEAHDLVVIEVPPVALRVLHGPLRVARLSGVCRQPDICFLPSGPPPPRQPPIILRIRGRDYLCPQGSVVRLPKGVGLETLTGETVKPEPLPAQKKQEVQIGKMDVLPPTIPVTFLLADGKEVECHPGHTGQVIRLQGLKVRYEPMKLEP